MGRAGAGDRRADAPRGRAGEAAGARDHAARADRGLPRLRPARRQPLRPGDHLEVPGVDRGPPVPRRLDVPPAARPLRHVPHLRDARAGRADRRRGRRPGAVPRRPAAAQRARRLLRAVGPRAAGRRRRPPRAGPPVAGRPPARALARRGRAVPAGGAPPPRPVRARSPPAPATSRRAPTRSSPTPRPTCRARTGSGSSYLFTASRLDGPKRLDLLIDAMAHVPQEIPLLIGGTGPLPRTCGCGPAPTRGSSSSASCPTATSPGSTPTRWPCRSSPPTRTTGSSPSRPWPAARRSSPAPTAAGPTELITHGVNGLVTEPTPAALGAALAALAADPARARKMGRAGRYRAARHHLGLDGGHRPRLAVDRPAPPEPVIDLTQDAPVIAAPDGRARPGGAAEGRGPDDVRDPQARATAASSAAPTCTARLAHHLDVEVAQPRGARPPGRHPHARARASGSRPSPAATSTTRSAAAPRAHAGMPVTDIVAGTEIARSPAYLAALPHGARRRRARAPGRAVPPARARGGRRRPARGSTTRSTSRPTSRPAPSPAATSASSSSPTSSRSRAGR